jgi:hypothetical protein
MNTGHQLDSKGKGPSKNNMHAFSAFFQTTKDAKSAKKAPRILRVLQGDRKAFILGRLQSIQV